MGECAKRAKTHRFHAKPRAEIAIEACDRAILLGVTGFPNHAGDDDEKEKRGRHEEDGGATIVAPWSGSLLNGSSSG